MMLRKIVMSAIVLTAMSTGIAFADGAPYLGLNAGLNTATWKLQKSSGTTNFNARGVSGGLFGGYGATVSNNLYLGGELFLTASSTHTSTKSVDALGDSVRLRTTYSYGASIIPGIKVGADSMVYARAGIVRTRFEMKMNPSPAFLIFGETGNTVTGGQLGLGAQTSLTKNIDVRGEYDYTAYRSFTAYGNKVSPHNNQFNLGIVYKFS